MVQHSRSDYIVTFLFRSVLLLFLRQGRIKPRLAWNLIHNLEPPAFPTLPSCTEVTGIVGHALLHIFMLIYWYVHQFADLTPSGPGSAPSNADWIHRILLMMIIQEDEYTCVWKWLCWPWRSKGAQWLLFLLLWRYWTRRNWRKGLSFLQIKKIQASMADRRGCSSQFIHRQEPESEQEVRPGFKAPAAPASL